MVRDKRRGEVRRRGHVTLLITRTVRSLGVEILIAFSCETFIIFSMKLVFAFAPIYETMHFIENKENLLLLQNHLLTIFIAKNGTTRLFT